MEICKHKTRTSCPVWIFGALFAGEITRRGGGRDRVKISVTCMSSKAFITAADGVAVITLLARLGVDEDGTGVDPSVFMVFGMEA